MLTTVGGLMGGVTVGVVGTEGVTGQQDATMIPMIAPRINVTDTARTTVDVFGGVVIFFFGLYHVVLYGVGVTIKTVKLEDPMTPDAININNKMDKATTPMHSPSIIHRICSGVNGFRSDFRRSMFFSHFSHFTSREIMLFCFVFWQVVAFVFDGLAIALPTFSNCDDLFSTSVVIWGIVNLCINLVVLVIARCAKVNFEHDKCFSILWAMLAIIWGAMNIVAFIVGLIYFTAEDATTCSYQSPFIIALFSFVAFMMTAGGGWLFYRVYSGKDALKLAKLDACVHEIVCN
jgi:hypothetical protein